MLQITDTNKPTSVITCEPDEVATALHALFEGHPPYMHSTIDYFQAAITSGNDREVAALAGCLALTVEAVPIRSSPAEARMVGCPDDHFRARALDRPGRH